MTPKKPVTALSGGSQKESSQEIIRSFKDRDTPPRSARAAGAVMSDFGELLTPTTTLCEAIWEGGEAQLHI